MSILTSHGWLPHRRSELEFHLTETELRKSSRHSHSFPCRDLSAVVNVVDDNQVLDQKLGIYCFVRKDGQCRFLQCWLKM
jgi:hypothetical protein